MMRRLKCFDMVAIIISRIVSLWHHVATYIRVNIGFGNGLLPDGTQPLSEHCWLHSCGWSCILEYLYFAIFKSMESTEQ